MDLRQLQHFVAVAEEKHFTRAARRMNIVQSALSSSIRSLETELGGRLFHRTARGVRITPEGQGLYDKARQVLAAAREARESVAAIQTLERGRLTLGTVHSLPAFLDLPVLLTEFHRRHPGVEVHLRQADRQLLVDQVADSRLDLAVLPALEMPTGLDADIVLDEPMVLACPPGHPLAERAAVSVEDLADQTFIDFQVGWGTRALVDRWFAESGVRRRVLFEVNTLETMLALAGNGVGLCLSPAFNVANAALPLTATPLSDGPRLKMLAVYIASDNGGPQTPAARAFKAVLDSRKP